MCTITDTCTDLLFKVMAVQAQATLVEFIDLNGGTAMVCGSIQRMIASYMQQATMNTNFINIP